MQVSIYFVRDCLVNRNTTYSIPLKIHYRKLCKIHLMMNIKIEYIILTENFYILMGWGFSGRNPIAHIKLLQTNDN